MNLNSMQFGGSSVVRTERGWRLTVLSGTADHYRLAQLDDYHGLQRSAFQWRPPFKMVLRARVSRRILPGTWGFGLWNDPFGLTFGSGSRIPRLPALPHTAWFIGSSARSYLSLRDDKPANGFVAQVFRSARNYTTLIPAILCYPISGRAVRRILKNIIQEDAQSAPSDPSEWHEYGIEWSFERTTFWQDGQLVLESILSPTPPLGLVIWIDNQYAAFQPSGRLRWGKEKNPEEVWLEIEGLHINK